MKSELQDLVATFPDGISLLEGSHVLGGSDLELGLKYWLQNRQPIIQAIHHGGALLDVGCANGFLLACLIRWSKHEITPYGIDSDPESIRAAQTLLPRFADHFVQCSLEHLHENSRQMVDRFDFVFWNVWDGLNFDEKLHLRYARNAFGATRDGGRVILGFYDLDRTVVKKQLQKLVELFGPFKDKVESEVVFAWWDIGG